MNEYPLSEIPEPPRSVILPHLQTLNTSRGKAESHRKKGWVSGEEFERSDHELDLDYVPNYDVYDEDTNDEEKEEEDEEEFVERTRKKSQKGPNSPKRTRIQAKYIIRKFLEQVPKNERIGFKFTRKEIKKFAKENGYYCTTYMLEGPTNRGVKRGYLTKKWLSYPYGTVRKGRSLQYTVEDWDLEKWTRKGRYADFLLHYVKEKTEEMDEKEKEAFEFTQRDVFEWAVVKKLKKDIKRKVFAEPFRICVNAGYLSWNRDSRKKYHVYRVTEWDFTKWLMRRKYLKKQEQYSDEEEKEEYNPKDPPAYSTSEEEESGGRRVKRVREMEIEESPPLKRRKKKKKKKKKYSKKTLLLKKWYDSIQ